MKYNQSAKPPFSQISRDTKQGQVLCKVPNNITAHLALIELYHRQGMKSKLITIIGKILSLSPEGNISGMIKKDRNKFFPYTPDPKTLVPILQSVNIEGVLYSKIPRLIKYSPGLLQRGRGKAYFMLRRVGLYV